MNANKQEIKFVEVGRVSSAVPQGLRSGKMFGRPIVSGFCQHLWVSFANRQGSWSS